MGSRHGLVDDDLGRVFSPGIINPADAGCGHYYHSYKFNMTQPENFTFELLDQPDELLAQTSEQPWP